MTARAAFEPDEWKLIEEAPTSAAMLVILSQRGGTFRETLAMGKEYAEARQQHGKSELLDELVSARPHVDHTRFHSPEELRDHVTEQLRAAVGAVQKKADPQELEDYRNFIVSLARRVAGAHSEGGQAVSEAERAAIEAIEGALAQGVGARHIPGGVVDASRTGEAAIGHRGLSGKPSVKLLPGAYEVQVEVKDAAKHIVLRTLTLQIA